MEKSPSNEILFEEISGSGGSVGIITLNRPHVLNSLNYQMIAILYEKLQEWERVAHIKAVVITAAPGRAFCAGGDLRSTYEGFKRDKESLIRFFQTEYCLNQCIFHYSKPYIALLNGITMGGGAGISINGSHRIATDNLTFAMPETGIGFFPDVGGSYFLPRLPGYMGIYLGLTGTRLNSDDCVELGLAHYKIDSTIIPTLINTIANTILEGDAKVAVHRIIQQFQLPTQASSLFEKQSLINSCFSQSTIEEILSSLAKQTSDFCEETIHLLEKKSPTSLKVSLLAMQKGKTLNFDSCMQQEFALMYHFLQASDFVEGIRAVIIDKDQQPRWQPASLKEISLEKVHSYFKPVLDHSINGSVV